MIGLMALLLWVFCGTLNAAASEYLYSTQPSNISRENRFGDSFLRRSTAFDSREGNNNEEGGLRGSGSITPGAPGELAQGEEGSVGDSLFLLTGFILAYGIRLYRRNTNA